MRFSKDVFISYAHLDNHGGAIAGWVNRFHETLDGVLSQRLGHKAQIWRDEKLKGNDVFSEEIVSQLPNTAVLVSVISPRYIQSEWCLREASIFCTVAQQPPGLKVNNKSRIFKIIKTPPPTLDPLPAPMRETLGFDFFVRVKADNSESKDEDDAPLELDSCYSADLEKKFNSAVAKLAWDICKTLEYVEKAGIASVTPLPSSAPQAIATTRPTVYLADCAYDRRDDRDALRSELAMHGYPVLPDRLLPEDEAEYRAEVTRLLERSALSVHLLGASEGLRPAGEGKDSVVVIQNALSVERARAAPLRRVVSLPNGTVAKNPRHQQFLDAMHRDADMQGVADVIGGDLEAVKAQMHVALKRIELAQAAKSDAASASDATKEEPRLYVIYDKTDLQATGDLRDVLEMHFKVLKPAFGGTAEEVRQANEERLTQCDAVLIYYGSGTDMWMDSVSSEVEKAAALRPGRPLRAVFKWLAGPPTDDKNDKMRNPKPDVINALSGFSESLVEPIVKTLLGPIHG